MIRPIGPLHNNWALKYSLKQALALREELHGEGRPETAAALSSLARL